MYKLKEKYNEYKKKLVDWTVVCFSVMAGVLKEFSCSLVARVEGVTTFERPHCRYVKDKISERANE